MLNETKVSVVKDDCFLYSNLPPFHPSERYPEFDSNPIGEVENPAFRSIRKAFHLLGMDLEHYDTENWNPLGRFIQQGDTVLIKPNLVTHENQGGFWGIDDTDSLVTHGSVIRAVIDYVIKGLHGEGTIIVGDCPLQGANWERILDLTCLNAIFTHIKSVHPKIKIYANDYRLGKAVVRRGQIIERVVDDGRIDECSEVDLKGESLLVPLMEEKVEFGVVQYPKHRMKNAHTHSSNKYLIPNDILNADLVINLPKMKSHMKAGITCSLKNLVGINGHKDYLPHFRFGSPKNGGDEYPDGGVFWDLMWHFAHLDWELEKGKRKRVFDFLRKLFGFAHMITKKESRDYATIGGGSWYGNDTLWRTVLDINRAFFYYNRRTGAVGDTQEFPKYLTIVDGIVAGEREAPLAPSPVKSGLIFAGMNPVAVDAIVTAMMGFDIDKVKQVGEAFKIDNYPLVQFSPDEIKLKTNFGLNSIQDIYSSDLMLSFVPSMGYRGHVEYERG